MNDVPEDLPLGWAWVALGELGNWGSGGTPSRGVASYYGGDLPWLKIADLTDGDVTEAEEYITQEGLRNSSAKRVEPATVLVAMYGSIGKYGVARIACATNQAIAFCRSHQELVTPEFLAMAIRRYRADLVVLGQGGTQANISQGILKSFRIPLPPIAEQHRILAKLDELFASSRAARAALGAVPALLERYRQAVLAAAFAGELTDDWREQNPQLAAEWRALPWREVGRCQNGRAFPSKEYSSEGVRLLRPGNLHASGRVEWTVENTRHMPLVWAERFPKHVVGSGELVMNLTAQSLKDEFLGRICMTGQGERCLLNQRIARLTARAVDTRFAFWAFKSPQFRRYVDGLNTGSLIQHMFTSQIDDFVMPVPSAEEQREIVRRIEALLDRRERLAGLLTSAEDQLAPLETALLARAFRGQLVPQDPTDEPADILLERNRAERTEAPARRSRQRTARA